MHDVGQNESCEMLSLLALLTLLDEAVHEHGGDGENDDAEDAL